MIDYEAIDDMEYRIRVAHSNMPSDFVTKLALILVKVITATFVIFLPIQLIMSGVGGCLAGLTFGLFMIVLNILWLPFNSILLGTSWLWLHAWYLRPVLLFPGVLIAAVADLCLMILPGPSDSSRHARLSIIEEWPLSWYLLRPPSEYHPDGPMAALFEMIGEAAEEQQGNDNLDT